MDKDHNSRALKDKLVNLPPQQNDGKGKLKEYKVEEESMINITTDSWESTSSASFT